MNIPSPPSVILFAHGSRDPLWQRPVEAVAARIRQDSPQTPVRCAYLELTAPDLPTVTAELVGLGAQCIHVLPLFLGIGKHAREDLPVLFTRLQQQFPHVRFQLLPSVGETPAVIELLAKLALTSPP